MVVAKVDQATSPLVRQKEVGLEQTSPTGSQLRISPASGAVSAPGSSLVADTQNRWLCMWSDPQGSDSRV